MEIMNTDTIGARVKELRIERGFQQKDIIRALKELFEIDITPASYSNYESSKRKFPSDLLPRLAVVLDCNVDQLTDVNHRLPSSIATLEDTASLESPDILNVQYHNPLITYMKAEGFDVFAFQEDGINVYIESMHCPKTKLSKKDFESLNKSLIKYLEFELYCKNNQ